jgi:hypothetical protein
MTQPMVINVRIMSVHLLKSRAHARTLCVQRLSCGPRTGAHEHVPARHAAFYGSGMGLIGNVAMMFQAAPSVDVRAASSHWYRTVTKP